MAIARAARPVSGRDRPARWLTAVLLASTIVGAAVAPALAADPATPVAGGSTSAPAEATPAPDPTAAPTASPEPTASPSPSPVPTASPDPTPVPTESPSPTPTPVPTATPTPWPTPAWPTAVTTLGSSVRFYGLGYGHGVGMSQYGARGRALAGQTAEEILAAYYTGATVSATSAARTVRVLVLTSFPAPSTAPLIVVGRGGTWGLTGTAKVFPANAQLRAWRTTARVDGVSTTTWRVRVKASDGTVLHSAVVTGHPYLRPLEPASYLQLVSRPSSYDTYRGTLRLLLRASSASVVNHVGLDAYLGGVVPMEMPSSWPREALRAQAIAARSYAVKELNSTTGTYDMFDDTRSQVYRGIEGEKAATNAIIAAEPGAVIRYGDVIIKAFFFSTGGGATEDNEYVFVASSGAPGTSRVAWLRGITDRSSYGIPYDKDAPYFDWATSTLSRDTLSAMLAKDPRTNTGSLLQLDLRRRGVSGRLYQVVLIGSKGTKTVSADVFRSVYNGRRPAGTAMLRSNLFDTQPVPLP
jgi:SpoIID/LytB domain protein